jgi:hypothetical protein
MLVVGLLPDLLVCVSGHWEAVRYWDIYSCWCFGFLLSQLCSLDCNVTQGAYGDGRATAVPNTDNMNIGLKVIKIWMI